MHIYVLVPAVEFSLNQSLSSVVRTNLKFPAAKRTHVPLSHAKFHVDRCNESPLREENADFRLLGKFNTGSLPVNKLRPCRYKDSESEYRSLNTIINQRSIAAISRLYYLHRHEAHETRSGIFIVCI